MANTCQPPEENWALVMLADQSFKDVMARLRVGDNEAATRVFNRYASQLIELAQKKLHPKIRRKVDPEDVLQSVFRSFFTRQAAGKLDEPETWDNLWGLLVFLTLRKCGRRIHYFHLACRDVDREVSDRAADQSGENWEPSAEGPTPEEEAMLTEAIEQLMNRLEGRHREILSLRLQGYTPVEISVLVGCTERQVFRVLERVKGILESMRLENENKG
jgi:RNA polymerase sigma-70 factor (ECF subfamily)